MRRLPVAFVVVLALIGVLAPILANDQPLVARVDGSLRFPAFAALAGGRSLAPTGQSWKEWRGERDEAHPGFALMPPLPYAPDEIHARAIKSRPSATHPLGTDDGGRDVLARLLHGTATALQIALGALLLTMLAGIPLGALAGYCGGRVDACILRLIEAFLCFPKLFMALAVGAFVGGSKLSVICVLGALGWTQVARLVRGEILSLREREFVLCARGLGVGTIGVIVKHLLPAARGPLFVAGAFVCADAILVESTLAFLGLSAGEQVPSWGALLQQGKLYAHEGAWHLWLFPSAMLIATLWTLHALADRLTRAR